MDTLEGKVPQLASEDVMNRSTTTTQAVINRRTVIGGAGAVAALLAFPGRASAKEKEKVDNSFILLLKGLYHPVVDGPDLGLSTVNINDGSYSTTKIYPVNGIAGSENVNVAVGDFFGQFAGDLCAYQVPGGTFSMRFTGQNTILVPDGSGGNFLQGTFELTILEATGIFRHFAGGHNHMLDNLHFLTPGDGSGGADEYCVCFITRRNDK
jgi:hypothetical protein